MYAENKHRAVQAGLRWPNRNGTLPVLAYQRDARRSPEDLLSPQFPPRCGPYSCRNSDKPCARAIC